MFCEHPPDIRIPISDEGKPRLQNFAHLVLQGLEMRPSHSFLPDVPGHYLTWTSLLIALRHSHILASSFWSKGEI